MRRWVFVSLFILISSVILGWQRNDGALNILSATYRVERVQIGRTTIIPSVKEKLLVVRFSLSKEVSQIGSIDAIDTEGKTYRMSKNTPLAALRSATDEPESYVSADHQNLRGSSIFMATILIPRSAVIAKVSFGGGRSATTTAFPIEPRGLDYYVETGVTPLQSISASRDQWYVSGGLDLRFDGWTSKTGMLGEIEGTEEGEIFVIGTFSVRNKTAEKLTLFSPKECDLPFVFETATGEKIRGNETALLPDSDHGLDDFALEPKMERTFRIFWKVPRGNRPKSFSVVEKTLGVESRPIVWPADGKGTTSSAKNSPRETTQPSALDAENIGIKGVRVSASGLVKKFPELSKQLRASKIPNFNQATVNLGGITIPVDPIVIGPTVEGKIFPKGKFEAKATGTKVTVDAQGETKIVATLQILNSGKVVREASGKSISLSCPKKSMYGVNFGISVGTPPGTYTGRFLIQDGVKREVPVTFIIVAKSGGVALSPAFGSVPVIPAGDSVTLPFQVQLQGNARSKVTFGLDTVTKGLTLSGETITLNPGESRTVNLTLSASDTAQSNSPLGDEIRIAANAVDLHSTTSVAIHAFIEPIYGVFEYHGKIGNVTYGANFVMKASGDWCWTVSASTSSKVSGDTLLQCLCLNYPDQGFRHFIQIGFPLGAKIEKLPGALTYISSGNDSWIRDHFSQIFDNGFSVKLARIDNGILSFTNNVTFDPGSSAPAKYVKWMASQKCKDDLKPSFAQLIK